MLTIAGDNISSSDEAGQYPVLLSPDLIEEYDLYIDLDTDTAGLETLIQHPNNGLNIVIITILLILGLTNNLIAFPVMLFRYAKHVNRLHTSLSMNFVMKENQVWQWTVCSVGAVSDNG